MKLSTKGRYGLKALVDLAVNGDKEAVSAGSIAQRQDISEGYLEQLLARLKKAGIVVSARGAHGGYFLARPAEQIRVGDVLRALEGSIEPAPCPGLEGECTDASSCVTKNLWRRINEGLTKIVDETSLRALIEESGQKLPTQ
ncbi:MAG TPA: AsnC family transcriptional regulator [Clostridiales bacterium]|nr:AsnC family transcriptional regulator [Clostridiales bacterium]